MATLSPIVYIHLTVVLESWKKAVEEATVAYQAVFPEAILWAIIDENNEASLGFAGALGYEVQGESKDGFVVMVKGWL